MIEYGQVKVLEIDYYAQQIDRRCIQLLSRLFDRMMLDGELDRMEAHMIVMNIQVPIELEEHVTTDCNNQMINTQAVIERGTRRLHVFKRDRNILKAHLCNYTSVRRYHLN